MVLFAPAPPKLWSIKSCSGLSPKWYFVKDMARHMHMAFCAITNFFVLKLDAANMTIRKRLMSGWMNFVTTTLATVNTPVLMPKLMRA